LFDYVSRQKNYKAGRRSAAKLSLNQSRGAPLFSDDAAELIHQASRGYPRAVNRLAAAALLATYTTNKTIADTTAVRAAITEVNDQ
jgi:type II secretory pathway predicted ATPase ExeA